MSDYFICNFLIFVVIPTFFVLFYILYICKINSKTKLNFDDYVRNILREEEMKWRNR